MRKRTINPKNTIGRARAEALFEGVRRSGKVAMTVTELEATDVYGGRTFIYDRIADGTLPAVKLGANTLLLITDIIDAVAAMPVIEPRRVEAPPKKVSRIKSRSFRGARGAEVAAE